MAPGVRRLKLLNKKLFLLFVVIIFVKSGFASEEHIFWTWPGIEPDKCASAWAISRFVNKDAKFVFVKRGKFISEGISFDTPYSKFRTTHNMTCFDSICKKFGLYRNESLKRIGNIVRDIELNKWEEPITKEAKGLRVILEGLRLKEGESVIALKKSFQIFDWLYSYYEKGFKR